MISACRLCSSESQPYYEALRPFRANYYQCPCCGLIQVDADFLIPAGREKSHYQMHENDKRDPGYLAFLERCLEPASAFLRPGASGLDFGCGPYPMLAEIMGERGFPMDYFDPYFFPRLTQDKQYEFVTATEVVEHFYEPGRAWRELVDRARVGGIIAVMTSIKYEELDFAGWHYRRDETHVCFYTPETFRWIAQFFKLEILESLKNVVIFKKSNGAI